MHNGLGISPFRQPIKYLKPSLLCLNLSDTTIWSTFTDNNLIGSLDFLFFLIKCNIVKFQCFFTHFYIKEKKIFIFYIKEKTKNYLFFILRKKQKIIYFLY